MTTNQLEAKELVHYVPVIRYIIYCWDCDEAAATINGRASDEFIKHKEHRTEIVQLSRYPEGVRWSVE
jgi:hypothetical protein